MSISSKELASLLGISPSAVSLALNGKAGISDETRSLILRAAEEYGIKRPARRSSQSEFINLVIYKKHGLVYGDTAFFSAVIEGISAHIAKLGYNLQVSYFYGNQDQEEQFKILKLSECAGIILLATEMLEEDILLFEKLSQPLVVLDSYFETLNFDCVVINNVQGAYLATRYLLGCGHRHIGHIASSVPINNFAERSEGFHKAVAEAPDCVSCHVRVSSTQEGAYRDMSAYLDASPELPTAFFADNDIIAVSCIRALKEHGYRIPDDISFIGFDDMPLSYVTSPKLTTVHVSKESFGQRAVMRLAEKIEDQNGAPLKIAINTTLTVRDSVLRLTEAPRKSTVPTSQ